MTSGLQVGCGTSCRTVHAKADAGRTPGHRSPAGNALQGRDVAFPQPAMPARYTARTLKPVRVQAHLHGGHP